MKSETTNKLSTALLLPILEESEEELFERNPDNGRPLSNDEFAQLSERTEIRTKSQ